MVQEYRQINLDKEEMIVALAAHQRVTPDFLPDGEIVDFVIIDQSSIIVTVAVSATAQEVSVIFPDDALVHALIRFCMENNIMLPRQGHKSVRTTDHGISLCVALDIETYCHSGAQVEYPLTYAIVN